eukprot:TRINITY_DN9223_c0_g1_i2.p1 TRINITY_DN9223_c0_g1~~TRINITY_DN9223_c0_g1_i2.p1  ORF type:complete len:455 (-),score=203.31 TRINITY_DN9223_c0_g1_i2:155-1519(-)
MKAKQRRQAEAPAGEQAKKREGGANFEALTQTIEEKILKTVHDLYTKDKDGLVAIGNGVKVELQPPRKKVSVMICGNHSSGKSSFVNWYVGENVQKTGVAIETQGVTFVQNGKRRETLQGPATVSLYPQLRDIAKEKGVLENLCTELSISTERKFGLVTFIDTPGLVDGTTQYPFDVFKVIKFFADQADLIFVFFDPIGQALCTRTMKAVGLLNQEYPERVRYFLSKADDVVSQTDLNKVMVQITQNLSMVVRNKNFDLQTIYLPSEERKSNVPNCISDLCKTIEKTINFTVQRTLDDLERDCNALVVAIDRKLADNDRTSAENSRARNRGVGFGLLALTSLLMVFLAFAYRLIEDFLRTQTDPNVASAAGLVGSVGRFAENLSKESSYFAPVLLGLAFVLLLLSKFTWRQKPTLSRKEKSALLEQKKYVTDTVVKKIRKELYDEYLHEVVHKE